MTIHDITPEFAQAQPAEALRIITHENPQGLASQLVQRGFTGVPEMPEPLFQYLYNYLYKNNGNRALVIDAFNNTPILTPNPAS